MLKELERSMAIRRPDMPKRHRRRHGQHHPALAALFYLGAALAGFVFLVAMLLLPETIYYLFVEFSK